MEHPTIKSATSVFDYLFRLPGYEYLQREDLVHVPSGKTEAPAPPAAAAIPAVAKPAAQPEPATDGKAHGYTLVTQPRTVLLEQTQQVLANMMGDAPICNVCGHITIGSGTCYKCLNCGNSLGCS